jgi:hypothetical protein
MRIRLFGDRPVTRPSLVNPIVALMKSRSSLAGIHVAREKTFNPFAEKRLAKDGIALYASLDRFL